MKKLLRDVYCDKCGCLAVHKKFHPEYDYETGEKAYRVKSVCPNRKWYNNHISWVRTASTKDLSGNLLNNFYLTVDDNMEITNL